MLHVSLPAGLREVVSPQVATAPSSAGSDSPAPETRSREAAEVPGITSTERAAWPWVLTGLLGLGAILALVRSLRRR